MHIRKFLSIFLIGLVFAIAGCSSDSTSGISDEDRLPDTDNDGIVDKNDPDIDGDGIVNKDDTDDDGDGTPDATDPTPNGDGDQAPTPGLVCTSAKIKPPRNGITGRLNTVSWELLPERCEATVSRTVVVTASADKASTASTDGDGKATTESQNASLGRLTTNIILPQDCDWSGVETIAYDFSEIGNALGDVSGVATGSYTQEVLATVGKKGCNPPPIVEPDFIVGPADNELIVNADGSVTGPSKASVYTMAQSQKVSELSEPKWSTELSIAYMNIYVNGGGPGKNARINIDSKATDGIYNVGNHGADGKYSSWADLQASEYGDYSVRTNYTELNDDGIKEVIPPGGNFILRLGRTTHGGPNWTLKAYSVNQ